MVEAAGAVTAARAGAGGRGEGAAAGPGSWKEEVKRLREKMMREGFLGGERLALVVRSLDFVTKKRRERERE